MLQNRLRSGAFMYLQNKGFLFLSKSSDETQRASIDPGPEALA